MSVRFFSLVLFLSCVSATAEQFVDPAVTLARILAQRGTLSSAELSAIESASDGQRTGELAAILQRKGLLSDTELAQLRVPQSDAPGPVRLIPAVATAVAQTPATQAVAAPRTSEVPVITQTNTPVTLYGTLLLNSFYNTAANNIQDVPLFLSKQGSTPTSGDKNFGMTARQTRLGLRLAQPDIVGAKLTGDFEFDLFGGKTPLANGMDMDMFRLRLAYGRLDWKRFAFEAGQDWTLFAPLNPTSLAEYAIPEFSASGNPWIRLPQIRAEFTTDMGSATRLLWQVAALDPNVGDYPTATFSTSRQPGIGESGRMPAIESRVAWTRHADDRDFTIGLSGHYGRGKNFGTIGTLNVHNAVDSWGVALDYSLPFTRYFNLTGEAFEGRALGIYSVTDGVSVGAVGTPGAHGVESRGGWVQAQFNLNRQWQVNLAYGLEVPNASQVPVGIRWRNQTYMGNVAYKLATNITLAWEYRRILTDYLNQTLANERGEHIDMAIGYAF